jgi:LytR cell envelope-related transcriptional attenuator
VSATLATDVLVLADIVDWFTKEVDHLPAVLSVAAALGLALLAPLYRAQRRDVMRLRAFMERDPDYPAQSVAASEAALDELETELEEFGVTGETGEAEAPAERAPTTTETLPAAQRVTSERPALTRITMERAALAPHPRWRRFVGRVTQARVMIAVAVAALVLGGGAIFVSERLLSGDGEEKAKAGKIDKASVNVAVLNGTAITGLAGKVGDVIQENGYDLGAVSTTAPGVVRTEVLHTPHNKKAAQKVAKDLGIDPATVELADRRIRREAGPEAEVIVIAGEDRARP